MMRTVVLSRRDPGTRPRAPFRRTRIGAARLPAKPGEHPFHPASSHRESTLRHLEAGGIVGVFPEGRRVRDWGEAPVASGAAWLATRADVPIVPVAVWGTQHAMPLDGMRIRRAPIRVVVGCPIEPSRFEGSDGVRALTDAVFSVLDREIRSLSSDGLSTD